MRFLALLVFFITSATQAEINITPGIAVGIMSYENGITDYSGESIAFNTTISNEEGLFLDGEYRNDGNEVLSRSDIAFTAGKRFAKSGVIAFVGYKITATEGEDENDENVRVDFSSTGVFGGLSKSFQIMDTSSISLSGAIGNMSAELSTEKSGINEEYSTSAVGMTAGIAFNTWFSNGNIITLGAKIQEYNFDIDEIQGETIKTIYAKFSFQL